MSKLKIDIKQIRSSFIKSISCQFLPLLIIGWSKPLLESLPTEISSILSLAASILFIYGYIKCWILAYQYAKYKGYPDSFGWLGILNIFGLSILFFLRNKRSINSKFSNNDSFDDFSISAIFVSYLAIEILFFPVVILGLICIGNLEPKAVGKLLESKDFQVIYAIPVEMFFTWYFFREMSRAKVNFKQLIGSIKKINYKLPIKLAIANYFFADGTSSTILYGLSFIVPKYVENQINEVYATTPLGYSFLLVSVLVFAPIMEELFFRGIIFQKLAIIKDPTQALVISALIFTVLHFRFYVISLFVAGVTLAILYFKTKQIIVPIICHFLYNLMVAINLIYWQFFSNSDRVAQITIAKFQQDFMDNIELNILFVALSAPYLGYFIYKNLPRNYNISQMPYFANQKTLSE